MIRFEKIIKNHVKEKKKETNNSRHNTTQKLKK